MPMIRIQTNIDIEPERKANLMTNVMVAGAELLDKPESYMMVIIDDGMQIQLSGTSDPCAFLDVRSVGTITEEQVSNLSGKLSEITGNSTGIGAGRIYINFTSVPPEMWGFDGKTFA